MWGVKIRARNRFQYRFKKPVQTTKWELKSIPIKIVNNQIDF